MLLTLPDFLIVIGNRSQELALSSNTSAEIIRYMNLATLDLRLSHDWVETRTSANLSFVASSTKGYATVTATTGFFAPSFLNNSDNDYKFWWAEPDVIYELDRGDRYTYDDVEHAFAKDGSNFVIYHDTTETLTLKYYSKYLVKTVTTGIAKETWSSTATDADTFLLENDDILITRTLMYLAQKEPKSTDQYTILKTEYLEALAKEKKLNPSQRPSKLETLELIG